MNLFLNLDFANGKGGVWGVIFHLFPFSVYGTPYTENAIL